jgi:hypothetical protein
MRVTNPNPAHSPAIEYTSLMVLYRELTNTVEARHGSWTIGELYGELDRRCDEGYARSARHRNLAISWSEEGELPREINVNHLHHAQTKTNQ